MEKTNYVGNITGSFVANVNVTNDSTPPPQSPQRHIKRNELTISWIALAASVVSLVMSVICISLVHSVSLASAWPGFVLGVLAVLTTVLLGFQIKSTIDIDAKFAEQQNRLGEFMSGQSEKYMKPNLRIVDLLLSTAKLSTLTYTWNDRYERVGDRFFVFKSTFQRCYFGAKGIEMDERAGRLIKEEVPSICADVLTSLVTAKKFDIIDDDFLVSEKERIAYLISVTPESIKSYFEDLMR